MAHLRHRQSVIGRCGYDSELIDSNWWRRVLWMRRWLEICRCLTAWNFMSKMLNNKSILCSGSAGWMLAVMCFDCVGDEGLQWGRHCSLLCMLQRLVELVSTVVSCYYNKVTNNLKSLYIGSICLLCVVSIMPGISEIHAVPSKVKSSCEIREIVSPLLGKNQQYTFTDLTVIFLVKSYP